MTNELFTGDYIGNVYQINEKAHNKLSVRLNKDNLKEVFENGIQGADIDVGFECQSINNTPIEFNATVSQTSDGNYKIVGELYEFLYTKEDFDIREEFYEYLEGEPDKKYDVDITFSGDELLNTLIESRLIESEIHECQASAVIVYGIFIMSQQNIG